MINNLNKENLTREIRRVNYIKNCYLRKEFLEIISNPLNINYIKRDFLPEEETFNCHLDSDIYDVKIRYNTKYEIALVKEISICDWKNDFSYNKSSIKLEYFNNEWYFSKSILENKKRIEFFNQKIESDNLFPEIIKYFDNLDRSISKKISRNFSLSELLDNS